MKTAGYFIILISLLLIRGLTKGRTLADLPKDLGDLFNAAISQDNAGITEVLARTGDTNTTSTAQNVADVSTNTQGTLNQPGLPKTGKTRADLVAMGKYLQSVGYNVQESPDFPPVTASVHPPGSKHALGLAIDVNADTGFRGGEGPALDNAQKWAATAGFKTIWKGKWQDGTPEADHYDHLHIQVG